MSLDKSSFLSSARQAITLSQSIDEEREYLIKRAPNAIEWMVSKQYANRPDNYRYWGSYGLVKEFFELRCPRCNDPNKIPENPWGLSRETLESEELLVWSDRDQDDKCRRCGTTRAEFLEQGLMQGYRNVHAIWGQRCKPLNSLVFTSKGLKTLGELLPTKDTVGIAHPVVFDVVGKDGIEPASDVGFSGVKPTKKITTEFNFIDESGEEHPILVVRPSLEREWVQAKDLKVGDTILVSVGANCWGNSKELTEDQAFVLGCIVANGSCGSDKWVKFSHARKEVLVEYCDRLYKGWPNVGYNKTSYQRSKDKDSWETGRGCVEWVAALRALGLNAANSFTKEVPRSVLESSRSVVLSFLRGYLSCDGHAYLASSGATNKNGVTSMSPSVGFGSVSRKLADQLRLILLNLGIPTTLTREDSVEFNSRIPNGNDFWRVEILTSYIPFAATVLTYADPVKVEGMKACVALQAQKKPKDDRGIRGSAKLLKQKLIDIDLKMGVKPARKGQPVVSPTRIAIGLSRYFDGIASAVNRKATDRLRPYTLIHILTPEFKSLLREQGEDALLDNLERFCDPSWMPVAITKIEDGQAETADITVPGSQSYVANGILNHNSGKSEIGGLIGTYLEHVSLVSHHSYAGGLQEYLGQAKGTPLQITFVASTATQSKDTIWAKYRNYRKTSPWFQRYVPWIKAQEILQETPKGMQPWEYAETDTVIKHGCMNLICNSKNSNSHGLAGATRIAAFVDELSRMKNTDSGQSASEVYRTMDAQCQTIQSASESFGLPSYFGMVMSISSPWSTDDYGMQLLETAKITPRMLASHKSTWEVNPDMPYEFFEDMMKKDPVGTMRNFGARPAGAANPFIERPQDFLDSAVDKNLKPTATFRHYEFTDPTGRSLLGVKLERAELIIGGTPRYLAVDAGANFDAFSVACAHGETDKDGNTITVFDWVIRLLTRSKKQEVYFESVYQLLKDMQTHLMIRQIEFDHWNSKMIVQRIRNDFYQTRAEEVVTTNEHFINFMRDAYSGYVRMLPALEKDAALDPPYKSAQGAAIYEILGLERDPKNDKIFNSMKGRRRGFSSDDTARVIVHAHRLVQEQGYTKKQDDNSKSARRKKAEHSLASWISQGRGQVVNLGGLGKTRPPA